MCLFFQIIIKKLKRNVKVIGTALQYNYRGESFTLREIGDKEKDSNFSVGNLMELARPIIHQLPVCTYNGDGEICGRLADYPQRWRSDETLSKYEDATIVVGGKESYAPRCAEHFHRPEKKV